MRTLIGVTAAVPTVNPVIATSATDGDKNHIISDNNAYEVKYSNGNLTLAEKSTPPTSGDKIDAGVSINSAPSTMTCGETYESTFATFRTSGTASAQTNSVWTWTSSNPEVLEVTGNGSGVIMKALKVGTATVTVAFSCDTAMGTATTEPITVRAASETEDKPTPSQPSHSSGGSSHSTSYPVSTPSKAENGNVSVSSKNATKGSTVTVTIKPDSGYQLDKLTVTDKNGNELQLTDKGDGKFTFTMPSGKVDIQTSFVEIAEKDIPEKDMPKEDTPETDQNITFKDVSAEAYYYKPVKWAVENGVTHGMGDELFGSDYPCTRAQIITFLWQAAGSPETESLSGFSDVPADAYYAKAVAWAAKNGIAQGISDELFNPNATCTRAQSMTFLFRASKAAAFGAPAFSDVAADAYYAEAVKWAMDNGITSGMGDGIFGSDYDCTRAQIVTFLWKMYAGK